MKCPNMEFDTTNSLCTNVAPVSVELTSSKQAIVQQVTPLVMMAPTIVVMIDLIAVLEAVERDPAQE